MRDTYRPTSKMAVRLAVVMSCIIASVTARKPNILLMVADDLGIGDVGCFGNSTLKTPNIDSLARDGVKLSQHLTASSLCTPSRAAFLTGRYPARSGMTAPIMLRVGIFIGSSGGLPASEVTFAKLAKQAGYTTGLIGKWHLGWSRDRINDFHFHPLNHGFDYFYGLPLTNLKDFGDDGDSVVDSAVPYFTCRVVSVALVVCVSILCVYRAGYIGTPLTVVLVCTCIFMATYFGLALKSFKFLNSFIYRNYDIVEHPIDLETQMMKEVVEGREFLQSREGDDKPFLLVMSWMHTHTALVPSKNFLGKSKHGKYGDTVEELDWAVGEMLNSLKQLGMEDNTLVYFTSDNGGHLEEKGLDGSTEGGHNGIYKGGKGQCGVDGGIRVPSLLRWPGHVRAGSVSEEPTSQMDLLPTLAKVMEVPVPADRHMDGKDILPLLQGQAKVSPHEFLFHYCGMDIHAMRYRPRDGSTTWKLVFREPNYLPGTQQCAYVCNPAHSITLDPPVLYDMTADPGEQRPVNATQHPAIYKLMVAAMEEHLQGVQPEERQFTFLKLIWKPWLQICCNNNYPTCDCVDDKFRGKFS